MPDELKMTVDERRKVLMIMQEEYLQAERKRRSELLDQAEQLTGQHRKSLIRLLNGDLKRKPRRRQRGTTYGPEVDDALRVISESVDYIGAQRLVGNLSWLAQHLADHETLLEDKGPVDYFAVGQLVSTHVGELSRAALRSR